MAKTVLTDGSIVTPLYLNSINGTDAVTGHTHDGLNADGSVPKIRLNNATDITGIAPSANVTHSQSATVTFDTGGGFTTNISSYFFRVGNVAGIQFLADTELPAIVGGLTPIFLTNAAGNWPTDFFGTGRKQSTLGFCNVTTGTSSAAAHIEYTGTAQSMDLGPITNGGGYATNEIIRIREGSTFMFMLRNGEF